MSDFNVQSHNGFTEDFKILYKITRPILGQLETHAIAMHFLAQRLSVAIQRGNATSLCLDPLPHFQAYPTDAS